MFLLLIRNNKQEEHHYPKYSTVTMSLPGNSSSSFCKFTTLVEPTAHELIIIILIIIMHSGSMPMSCWLAHDVCQEGANLCLCNGPWWEKNRCLPEPIND